MTQCHFIPWTQERVKAETLRQLEKSGWKCQLCDRLLDYVYEAHLLVRVEGGRQQVVAVVCRRHVSHPMFGRRLFRSSLQDVYHQLIWRAGGGSKTLWRPATRRPITDHDAGKSPPAPE